MGAKMSNFCVHLYRKVQVLVNKPIVLFSQLDLGFVHLAHYRLLFVVQCISNLPSLLNSSSKVYLPLLLMSPHDCLTPGRYVCMDKWCMISSRSIHHIIPSWLYIPLITIKASSKTHYIKQIKILWNHINIPLNSWNHHFSWLNPIDIPHPPLLSGTCHSSGATSADSWIAWGRRITTQTSPRGPPCSFFLGVNHGIF